MKRINIYTFQNAINIGAFLQAYSLLQNCSCAQVFFPYKFSLWGQKYDIIAKKPDKLLFNIRRYLKFLKSQKVFNMKRCYDADIAVVGSDSIWDITEKTSGYIPEMFGVNLRENKIISYAGSFGTLQDQNALPEEAKLGLHKFDNILVRDENSQRIISKLGISSQIVLDPTLIYNYDAFLKDNKEHNYIMVYGGFDEQSISQIKEIKEKTGLKLYSIGSFNRWCDKSIPVSPEEFVGYVKNASYVITSMYHGSIFSMKYHKQFVSIFTEKRLVKAKTTFSLLGLEERILVNNDVNNMYTVLMKPIDFDIFEKRLSAMRQQSLLTLLSELK